MTLLGVVDDGPTRWVRSECCDAPLAASHQDRVFPIHCVRCEMYVGVSNWVDMPPVMAAWLRRRHEPYAHLVRRFNERVSDLFERLFGVDEDDTAGLVVVVGSIAYPDRLVAAGKRWPGSEVPDPDDDRPVPVINREWLGKIERAGLVVVVRKPDGSIGEQTTVELGHAYAHQRRVTWA